jgi:ChrR Cupin-like domain
MTKKRIPTSTPTALKDEVIPEVVLADMLVALPVASMEADREALMRTKLLRDVSTNMGAAKAGGTSKKPVVIRADEGVWINFAKNVDMKILHDDGSTRSWLARFGPGGCVPAHLQTGDEEAVILTGWCYLDDEKISAGDYHRVGIGERHGNIVSPDGCLIFVRSHSAKRHASQLVNAS